MNIRFFTIKYLRILSETYNLEAPPFQPGHEKGHYNWIGVLKSGKF